VLFQAYKDRVDELVTSTGESAPSRDSDELTFESLQARIQEEFWLHLEIQAVQSGWPRSAKLSTARSASASHKQALERLVIAANECQVDSIDMLLTIAEQLDASSLSHIANAGDSKGYRPYAIGPDILAFWLIRRHRSFSPDAIRRLSEPFRPELLSAALDERDTQPDIPVDDGD
jgi:hypothetical protein